MKINTTRIITVLSIAIVSIGLDQWTKVWAKATFENAPQRSFLNDTFRLLYVENEGAFLSLGSDFPAALQFWLLKVFPVVLLVGLVFYTLFSKALNRWQYISFSFILGGGLSNIYDRLLYNGVIDFMNMGIGDLRTGIFNVADVSIMIGLFMMLPELFKGKKKEEPAAENSASTTEEGSTGS